MITRLELLLKAKDENKKIRYIDGSYFQGYLMSLLNSSYAEQLHKNSLNPYSQYIFYDKDRECCVWRISTLTKNTKEKIILPVLNNDINSIYIEGNNTEYKVISKGITVETSYKEIADKYFLNDVKRNINIKMLSLTTYKSEDRYQMFPDVKSLFVSLYNKWNRFNDSISLKDEDVLLHLSEHTSIERYDLRSCKINTENMKISGFMGEMGLYVKGAVPLVNVVNILFDYAQYAGLGAKTGMGMGGVEIE